MRSPVNEREESRSASVSQRCGRYGGAVPARTMAEIQDRRRILLELEPVGSPSWLGGQESERSAPSPKVEAPASQGSRTG